MRGRSPTRRSHRSAPPADGPRGYVTQSASAVDSFGLYLVPDQKHGVCHSGAIGPVTGKAPASPKWAHMWPLAAVTSLSPVAALPLRACVKMLDILGYAAPRWILA